MCGAWWQFPTGFGNITFMMASKLPSAAALGGGTRSPFLSEGSSGRFQLHVASTVIHRVPVPGKTTVQYRIEVQPGHGMFGDVRPLHPQLLLRANAALVMR